MTESFRAEKSHTRRHLSEYTHCEAELSFITFEELLEFIQDMCIGVLESIMKIPEARAILEVLNPGFVIPKKPFKRMDYIDAINWLKENNITKEDGTFYEFGEDIPESPERYLIIYKYI